jgi:methylthioribose-1-phosphate isomerase
MAAMRVDGTPTRTIWPLANADAVEIIDQTALPHAYRVLRLARLEEVAQAICSMQVRGAPLIGVTAAYGLALAMVHGDDDAALLAAVDTLAATRPTAVNLRWALARMQRCLLPLAPRCVPKPPGRKRHGSPTKTSSSVVRSAATACNCCAAPAALATGCRS